MPQDSTSASATRFARDLRSIREERGVSIDDLHDETKIPLGLLEAFEQTALFDHPQFNRVYLRSFVRTYAQVVRISADGAISALEAALDDEYDGSLAREYLDETGVSAEKPEVAPAPTAEADRSPASPDEPAERPPASPDEPAEKPQGDVKPAASPPPKKAPEETKALDKEAERSDQEEAERTRAEKSGDRPRAYVSTTSVVAEAASEEEDWTAQSPPSGRTGQPHTRTRPADRDGGALRMWGWIAAAVVAFGLIIWLVTLFVGGSGPDEGPAGAAADTAAIDSPAVERPVTPQPARAVPALGDTMTFHVVAEGGKLDPIRVTVDRDLRRPYWLEQGDSLRFDATERIIIEERLQNARLTLEGIDYPVERTDEQGRVMVTRDSASAFLDRLR